MKSHSIVVSDADMDRLSRLVRALRHSLFRDQRAARIAGPNVRERRSRLIGAYSERHHQDELPYPCPGSRHGKERPVHAGFP